MRLATVLMIGVTLLGCRSSSAAAPKRAAFVPGTRVMPAPDVAQWIFKGDLQNDWQDHGWADRKPRKSGEPERHQLGGYGGWILSHSGRLEGTFGGLVFKLKGTPAVSDFLEVRVDSEQADVFPRVKVTSAHRRDLEGGWSEVFISMSELNPLLRPFDHVVMRAYWDLPAPGLVELDQVGLTVADASLVRQAEAALNQPGLPAAFAVECGAKAQPISPLIYGIGLNARLDVQDTHQWKLNATSRRWGGNPTSRYNWELGNAWNTGNDYYFQNVDYVGGGFTWKSFIDSNRDHRVGSAITLPTLGWVAKDTRTVSFPRSEYPAQKGFDPDGHNAGNGVGKDGKPIAADSPVRTSVAAPPDFIARWVTAIREHEARRGKNVDVYFLDNEPALWSDTHRDVHPDPVGYDELLDRTVKYGGAVRKAAPDALIAGPAEWGWPGYFYSAIDARAGFLLKPDRRKHGDVPLLDWYLKSLAAHEKATGTRVLDVLDLHFYPQGRGLGVGTDGNTDPDTNALRIRSTRALWDPTYVDESWIKAPVRLIPLMRDLVAANAPGLKLAIGEYNFGAERHLSGGLALAEALGRFGQEGLYAAWYWTYPPDGSPAFWAFRAYRDFDGKGAHFAELSLPTNAPRDASLFAARSLDGAKVTLIALNFSPNDALEAMVDLKGCAAPEAQRVFTYTGDARGFVTREVAVGKPYRLPPYSITVIELSLPLKK